MTNCTGIDGTNAADLSRAVLVCRNQLQPILDFLHEFVPGYESCYLLETASLIGVDTEITPPLTAVTSPLN